MTKLLAIPFQVIGAFLQILITPRYLLPLLVPFGIGIGTFWLSYHFGLDYSIELCTKYATPDSFFHSFLNVVAYIVCILLSSVISVLVMFSISGTFIEFFISNAFPRYGFIEPDIPLKPAALLKSLIRSTVNSLKKLVVICLLSIAMLICTFFPILLIFPSLITAFLTGYDLVSTPLALLEVPFSESWNGVKSHFLEVMTLGGCLFLCMLIPLGGVIFLPALYLVALKHIKNWAEIQTGRSQLLP